MPRLPNRRALALVCPNDDGKKMMPRALRLRRGNRYPRTTANRAVATDMHFKRVSTDKRTTYDGL